MLSGEGLGEVCADCQAKETANETAGGVRGRVIAAAVFGLVPFSLSSSLLGVNYAPIVGGSIAMYL